MAKTTLADVQELLCAYIDSDPVVIHGKVKVLAENKGVIEALVDGALANIGICAVVLTPSAAFEGATPEGNLLCRASEVRVQVFENPTLNRNKAGRFTALEIAEHLAVVCHDPQGDKTNIALTFKSMDPQESRNGVTYVVTFSAGVVLRKIVLD